MKRCLAFIANFDFVKQKKENARVHMNFVGASRKAAVWSMIKWLHKTATTVGDAPAKIERFTPLLMRPGAAVLRHLAAVCRYCRT